MQPKKFVGWNRLDNAAKIFPPTSSKQDTKVFRFACELTEDILPELLQMALDQTMEAFPFYQTVLKRGLFWYYLEDTKLKPVVHEEFSPPCSSIYDKNAHTLLFEVTYYRKRINFEIYHALSDGTGALQFLRLLTYNYLLLRYPEQYQELPSIEYDASMTQKMDDSFQKYYTKKNKSSKIKVLPAYRLKGARVAENRIQIIEGQIPVQQMLEKAHEYDTTLTAFVAALFLCAIAETMPVREKQRPVVLTVPVNLRKYFSSETARNFFSVFNVPYDFKNNSGDFKEVINAVHSYFKTELTQEKLQQRMNTLASLEHNIFARATPRFFKDYVLWAANRYADQGVTAALSNVGVVVMPDEMKEHIRLFDIFVSTRRTQICMCSYQDTLTITFTSGFKSTEVQKNFFRFLTQMGVQVTIVSNRIKEEGPL